MIAQWGGHNPAILSTLPDCRPILADAPLDRLAPATLRR